jgi:hypothetical protein
LLSKLSDILDLALDLEKLKLENELEKEIKENENLTKQS